MCKLRQVPSESRRGSQVPWSWSYRLLWDIVWVLETKLSSSARAGCILNYRLLSPAPPLIYWFIWLFFYSFVSHMLMMMSRLFLCGLWGFMPLLVLELARYRMSCRFPLSCILPPWDQVEKRQRKMQDWEMLIWPMRWGRKQWREIP